MTENRPTIFIIFGITGETATRKLLPGLLKLYSMRLLPSDFSIIGVARKNFSREDFRIFIRENLNIRPGQVPEEDIKRFVDRIECETGVFDNADVYNRINERIKLIEGRFRQYTNRLIHLAIPPSLYELVIKNISDSGLYRERDAKEESTWTRILIEKPFGVDINSASRIEKSLKTIFKEEQIFRIDHYLAKEGLQNILNFRFNNTLFESIWNHYGIDKIHIRLLEKSTVGTRVETYDAIGAIKDVAQSHILQMLNFITMERPASSNADETRKERAKILKNLAPFSAKDIPDNVVRARYEGYDKEKGVSTYSRTETYFLIKTHIDNSRWKNVPIYLESGKAMKDDRIEITVYFKNEKTPGCENIIVFRIKPEESIKIRFWSKKHGLTDDIESKTLSYKSDDNNEINFYVDYRKVLSDALKGDQTLFASADEIVYSWRFISSIIDNLDKTPLLEYKKGSWGPVV